MLAVIKAIRIIWELPQSIVALVVYIYCKISKSRNMVACLKEYPIVFLIDGKYGGVSLGPFIFISCPNEWEARIVDLIVDHEKGHSKQSAILGPLYLIIIGFPSAAMWIMSVISIKYGKGIFYQNYYKRWPESWADKLGGINRA